jgi:hypothetical protein
MFLAWAILSGLVGPFHEEESSELLAQLRERAISPGEFFIEACDEKFTDEDLNNEGNAFAQEYYDSSASMYLSDYEEALGEKAPTLYHVADTWENYDRLKLVLDRRFTDWKDKRNS